MALDLSIFGKSEQKPEEGKFLRRGSPRVLAPENLRKFLHDRCKLKFAPHGSDRDGLSNPYLDWSEGSACRKRYELLTKTPDPGKIGVLILESRGAGKSMSTRCVSFGEIADDPTVTHVYTAQTISMAGRRVKWVRQRITHEYPHMVNRDNWANEEFTVRGADPTSEDPTMLAAGPGKDIEGAHAIKYWLDDLVTKKSNATFQKRKEVIQWFLDAQKQFTPTTIVRAIGTRHKHHNLWEEIIEHYYNEFEIHILGCYDEDTGKRFYPWMNDEFLARQEEKDPVGFRLSYMNQKVESDEVVFEPSMLIEGDPPMIDDPSIPGGKRLHPRLRVYMLTDTAQTDRVTKGASETALVVLAKDTDDMRYIVDIDIGSYNPSVVHDRFMAMYSRWRPHGLLYATMEDRGPGRDYYYSIPKLARLDPTISFNPIIVMLKRSSAEDKDSRIGALHLPFKNGLFRFCTRFIRPDMFRIDARGYPRGKAADRILGYSRDGDVKKDFVDALADESAVVDGAQACPAPVEHKREKVTMTDWEWSRQRALGIQNRIKNF